MLKWDNPHEEKGKFSKFQQLWLGPLLGSGENWSSHV
jgi:hypothetical protein